jgi:membrane fusion protein, multidrug efflux system
MSMADPADVRAHSPVPEGPPNAPGVEARPQKEPAAVSRKHTVLLFIVAAVLIVVPLLGVLILTHRRHAHEAAQVTSAQAEQAKGPTILVTKVTMTPAHRSVVLPADTRAILATTLYAKTSGYVVDMKTDKGFRCKKGDVLAVLQSPEVDQQVAAARVDMDVKRLAAGRNDELVKSGIVSEQVREQAVGDYRSAVANLRQVEVLSGYEVIRAPFDGVVTARYVDPGALLPAATGSTQAAMPVVDVAKIDTLRAVVYLGQDIAAFIHEDDDVKLWQDERPTQTWPAKITRLAGNLDPRTRTELAEIWFDNRDRRILPGVYLHAEIQVKVDPTPLVSNEALITRGGKSYVAVIGNNVAHLAQVTVGYSNGRDIQIVSGLQGTETVGMNVPPEVVEGSRVTSVAAPTQAPADL